MSHFRMFALLQFLFFNVGLNGTDVITDFLTFLTFNADGSHPHYAAISLFWMLVPFTMQLGKYIGAKWTWYRNKQDSYNNDITKVLVQVPFILPLRNLYLAYKLHKLGYGGAGLSATATAASEAILQEVAQAGLYESYFEAGPQAVTQAVIIFCTGNVSTTQIVSIAISIVTLSLGGSRGFYTQRPKAQADPKPALRNIATVLPLMMVVLLTNLTMWVAIGGFFGGWTFLALFLNWTVNFAALKALRRWGEDTEESRKTREAGKPDNDLELNPMIETDKEGKLTKKEGSTNRDKYSMKASLCSMWLPCTIGEQPSMFLVSALTSQATKAITLAIAVTLALLGYQDSIQPNHFLAWCSEELKPNVTICSFQATNKSEACFDLDSDVILQVKLLFLKKFV